MGRAMSGSGEGELHDFGECLGITDRKLGQYLPIDVDLSPVKSGNEAGIRRTMESGRRIDAGDPELAECSFFCLAVAIGELHPLLNVMLGDRQDISSRTP